MENIRNICIIAHIDHGKTTMTDTLLLLGGLLSEDDAGHKRLTDTRDDEKERGITIKSTGVTLNLPYNNQNYTVNLIDSPGHVDFSAEVTAALRVTDGAIVIVDCVEGVCVQTETVLRQALAEQVKPILVINKLDRYFFELNLDAESAYQKLNQIINGVNVIIQTYCNDENMTLSPEKGNVFFACGIQGWGFGIKKFASMYADKFKIDTNKFTNYLWSDTYFDNESKKITKKHSSTCERMFSKLVYKPLSDIYEAVKSDNTEALEKMIDKLNIKLSATEKALTEKKKIFRAIMRKFLPLTEMLMDGIVNYLPSPKTAQSYRVTSLYEGPQDDPCALAIKNCDPEGPLMLYISKLVPTKDGGRFYAFGRIFSGTVYTGQKVTIMGANYKPGGKEDIYKDKSIQRTLIMIGAKVEAADKVPCGNTVALVGVDNYLLKSGTITTATENLYPIKTMKFSVSPVVQMAVEPKNTADLPKLIEGMKRLAKSESCALCFTAKTGESIIAGAGELHLEICLKDLRDFMGGADIKVSNPIVPFKETVTIRSPKPCLAKSPNLHNRLYVEAEPLDPDLVKDLENKVLNIRDAAAVYKHLTTKYNWDPTDAKKIWAFGPTEEPTNIIVDCTKGKQYMNEIKDHVVNGFLQVTDSGVLCEEMMRGVRFNIIDAELHADAIHRGGGQLVPATTRALKAAVLTSQPALIEPYYQVDIQIPDRLIGTIYSCLNQRRGKVIAEERIEGTPMMIIKGHLPVLESFGFNSFIRSNTSGQAFPQCVFDHWAQMYGDPLNTDSAVRKIIDDTRKRKRLNDVTIPPLDRFLDKL
jgi:elongation factor 2